MADLTRRHFEAIARAVKAGRQHAARTLQAAVSEFGRVAADCGAFEVARAVADYLHTVNPRFDRAKFSAATDPRKGG